MSTVITELSEINATLASAREIYYYEGFNKISLTYANSRLHRASPFGGMAHSPIEWVGKISYSQGLDAWEVTWRV